jgi:hypothetical protein
MAGAALMAAKRKTHCPLGHPLDERRAHEARRCSTCERNNGIKVKLAQAHGKHNEACTGALEPHVWRDPASGMYMPEMRCRCGAVRQAGLSWFDTWGDADRAAKRMEAWNA